MHLLLFLLASLLYCTGASSEEPITPGVYRLNVFTREPFNISLPENPTTGYVWSIKEQPSQGYVQYLGDAVVRKDGKHAAGTTCISLMKLWVGAPMLHVFQFKAGNVMGSQALFFENKRPWEKEAYETAVYLVQVLPGQ